jgi:hypothetical protein
MDGVKATNFLVPLPHSRRILPTQSADVELQELQYLARTAFNFLYVMRLGYGFFWILLISAIKPSEFVNC